MNFLYVLGGIACLVFGFWTITKQIKVFSRGKEDKYGFDIKILGGGVGFVIIGIGLIVHYI